MAQTGQSRTKYQREYYQNNKDKIKAKTKEWRKNNWAKYLENNKKHKIKWRYGITMAEYKDLLIKQNYRCAICDEHQNDLTRILVIDHCHATGRTRGLLCDDCNKALGFFDDNIALLNNAVEYLGSFYNDDLKDYTIGTNWSVTH